MIVLACSDPLGMENDKIKNSQITVSSTFRSSNSGTSARLHRNIRDWGAWCPNMTTTGKENIYYDQYIQIDLLHLTTITKVATQGREYFSGTEFVKTYQISYSYDNRNWMYYREKSFDVKVNIVKTGHDEYEHLHAFRSHAIYNICVRVVSDTQFLAFGSSLYIRYNTATDIVNSTYNTAVHDVVYIKLNIIY